MRTLRLPPVTTLFITFLSTLIILLTAYILSSRLCSAFTGLLLPLILRFFTSISFHLNVWLEHAREEEAEMFPFCWRSAQPTAGNDSRSNRVILLWGWTQDGPLTVLSIPDSSWFCTASSTFLMRIDIAFLFLKPLTLLCTALLFFYNRLSLALIFEFFTHTFFMSSLIAFLSPFLRPYFLLLVAL